LPPAELLPLVYLPDSLPDVTDSNPLASLVFWTPSNACSIFLQNKYKTTARLLSILVSFLGLIWIRMVEAGRAYYDVLGFGTPSFMALVKKFHALKPASSSV